MKLEVKNVSFSYDENKNVLKNLNMTVESHERVGILAPSGIGKTTLCKIMAGYLKPDEGEILVDGKPLPKKGYCPVQMIWQHPEKAVNPRLKLKDILADGDNIDPRIIKELGIEPDWMTRYPQELSGGELQRF